MDVTLNPRMQQFVERKLREGAYGTAEEVVDAALAALEQREATGDFAPGELDALLAEGEADFANGRSFNGDEVFRELDAMSAARRRARVTTAGAPVT